jgi:hypothetical protein
LAKGYKISATQVGYFGFFWGGGGVWGTYIGI